jgi:hypothetical protein
LVEFLLALGGVLEAEARVRVGDGHAATTAAGRALLTMRENGSECSCRAGDFRIHESSSFEVRLTVPFRREPERSVLGIQGTHPGGFRKSGKQRSCGIRNLEEDMKDGRWKMEDGRWI